MQRRGLVDQRIPRVVLAVVITLLTLLQSGCVRRRMTIRSSPPGAMVIIDNQPIGTTPVSTSFVYYGTRKIQLIKDGYETLTVYRKIKPPWYQVPGVDFVSENLWPEELRDERRLEFELKPQLTPPLAETLHAAEQLRGEVRSGLGAVSMPPRGWDTTMPPTAGSVRPLPAPRP